MAFAVLMLLASCGKESSEKKILSFKFAAPAVEATITESAKTIVAVVPTGTNLTSLVPIITVSEKATVVPASGTVVDFTNPVDFTVTAEDGSTVVYKATVTVDPNGGGGGGGGTGDPTTWSGTISANTTWPDLGLDVDYIIDGGIDIDENALLTIEPGVTIMFSGVDGSFYVGQNAGLRMVGTADKPIRFVNPLNNNNPGAWRGVTISSMRNDNQFEYVEFINGGAYEAPVVRNEGKLSMKHCLVDGGLGTGVELGWDGVFTAFENNTIKNVNCPLWLNAIAKASILGSGNNFLDNTNNMITVDYYWLGEQQTATLLNQGIPYYFTEGVNVCENSKLVINEGVEFVFDADKELIISEDGRLEVNGSASQPVVFRAKNAEDPWGGIMFNSNRTGNVINYAQIKNCGLGDYARCCLYISSEAKLTLTNNVFGPCNYNGVGIENISNWGNVTHSGNTFTECAGGNVYLFWAGEWNGVEYAPEQVLNELP